MTTKGDDLQRRRNGDAFRVCPEDNFRITRLKHARSWPTATIKTASIAAVIFIAQLNLSTVEAFHYAKPLFVSVKNNHHSLEFPTILASFRIQQSKLTMASTVVQTKEQSTTSYTKKTTPSQRNASKALKSTHTINTIQDLKFDLEPGSPKLISTLRKLKPFHSLKELESTLRIWGRKGKFEEALELYFGVWAVDSFREKLRSGKNSADLDETATVTRGSELMEEISNQLRPTTRLMNLAIDACARANPVQQSLAFEIFEDGATSSGNNGKKGGRLSPNVFTFGSLLASCARNGDISLAVKLLRELEGGSYPDVTPNNVIYSTVISACERSDPPRVDLALELLNNATVALSSSSSNAGGLGVVGFNAAISTMARAAQWQMAVRLLDEMIMHSNSNMESIRHYHGEQKLLLHVLDDTSPSSWADGREGEMIVPKPDDVTFGTVLAACERSGEWEELLRIANAARQNGVALDGIALTSVLHACQQLGLAEVALEYLELMKELGDGEGDESANSNTVDRRTRGRMRKGARQALRGPDGVAYRLAISACARAPHGARWKEGIRLLNEMRDAALKTNSTAEAPDVVAYTAAIAGCSEAGEYTAAMRLIQTMRSEGIMPNVVTFSAVMNACASASAIMARRREEEDRSIELEDVKAPMNRALRLLEAMKSPTSSVRPNIVTYNAAIRACAEGLNLDVAFDLLRQLKEDGLEPTVVTYGSLMTACERVGNIEAASKVFRMVKNHDEEDGIKANEIIYGAAISCCRKAGEPERALLLLRKMISEKLAPNTATFNTVIAALSEAKPSFSSSTAKGSKETTSNTWEKALSVYKVMKSKHAPPGVSPNRQTYNILIRNLATNLQPGYAESLLTSMCDAGFVPDVDLYTLTVRSYERCGNPMRALGLMESMREVGYDFYDIKVLDEAFKNAVKIVNKVGKGFATETGSRRGYSDFCVGEEINLYHDDDDDDNDYQILDSLKY
mmetsp:Transcript_31750/g.63553  ORF Transcript_31750/g.63553 Transcript_31750/m.63553 type:complete len:970 (+) Transcript_31750:35-2944(+)